jgi:hypothetical protein
LRKKSSFAESPNSQFNSSKFLFSSHNLLNKTDLHTSALKNSPLGVNKTT